MATNEEILIKALAGRRLSSVIFVENYIQFDFDGTRLSVFTKPSLKAGDGTSDSGRDALCGLIGNVVVFAAEKTDDEVSIGFEDGAILTMPIDDLSRHQVEAGTLTTGGHTLIVW